MKTIRTSIIGIVGLVIMYLYYNWILVLGQTISGVDIIFLNPSLYIDLQVTIIFTMAKKILTWIFVALIIWNKKIGSNKGQKEKIKI